MVKIPTKLHNPSFKFALARTDSKLPLEKRWNSDNNYRFFDPKLINHKGNYIVCAGYGRLIIIDFDDVNYYNEVSSKLPPTFTVLSSGKRLPHMYYLLNGEMFKKTAIKGKDKRVLCDIQTERTGCVGPGSSIERRFYTVVNNREIEEISLTQLRSVFKINPTQRKEYTGEDSSNPEAVNKTIQLFLKLGLRRMGDTLFQCPFHVMNGGGNLNILPNGNLYCFHETKHFFLENFIIDLKRKNG